jgi:hypothetical protein
MVEKKSANSGSWKQFLGVSVKLLAYLVLLFGVAFGMYWLRRHIPHH